MIDKIALGTTNQGKVREFASLLAPTGIEIIPIAKEIPETGVTFKENSRTKAIEYCRTSGLVTISEDSGLVIPYLNGLPGVYSAKFSLLSLSKDLEVLDTSESDLTREEIDYSNNQRVLELLEGVEISQRAGYFIVYLVVAKDKEILFESHASVHGWISEEMRGTSGFGYDPIFIGQDTFGKTYAELDPIRKNGRSHRKRLRKELAAWLSKEFLSENRD